MRELTAMDAQFLYSEDMRPAAMQHTLKVSIIEGDPATYSFESLKDTLRARLPLLEPFRWRAVRVPGDLHHPRWLEDPDFDLDFHVRRIGCPAPGSKRELCELIGDIAGRPLDRAKPLWEMYVIEGLADGTLATVVKMHHALADGVASSQLLDLVYDPTPEAKPLPRDDWRPEREPSRLRMLVWGLFALVRGLVDGLPASIRATAQAAQRKKMPGFVLSEKPPKQFEAPPMPFNGLLTPHRRFATFSVPLDDVRTIKTAYGTTINDVVLAVAAGGLRRYLERREVDVDEPLVGGIPVSTRKQDERPAWGNHLAKIYVHLPVDVADPVERLQVARKYSNTAKTDLERTLGGRIENWIEPIPVPFLKVLGKLIFQMIKSGKASENLVVSNVPGPRERLYIDGAAVQTFFSMGPLTESVGLNMTAWSYVDQMNVCLLACREMIPDLWELSDDVEAALAELLTLASSAPSEPPTHATVD